MPELTLESGEDLSRLGGGTGCLRASGPEKGAGEGRATCLVHITGEHEMGLES